jgi:hypothetical protein
VNRTRFTRNPTASNNKIGSPYTAPAQPVALLTTGSPYVAQNNFTRNNHSGNNNSQPQHNSQPASQPQGNWQQAYTYDAPVQNNPTMLNPTAANDSQHQSQPTPQPQGNRQNAYTYGRPAQNNPTMLNPPAVNHSASATSVQPAAPNTLNNSTDVRWYPTPRMRQFEQQSSRGNSGSASGGSASTTSASEPQTQHVSGGAKNQWRYSSQSGNASSQTASVQSSGQSASASPTTPTAPTIQPGRGWGKNQNSQQ